jgi:hypothetical protein
MEIIELAVTHPQTGQPRVEVRLSRFHVFDGSFRIVIEARDEEDARCLCTEMGWELICCCEG